jgi:acyl phosphate:glycerol-3-phosphate acyltransferase
MSVLLAGVALAYLVGAIPFALLLARTRGVDIRQVGSGNVGATNVFRSVDKRLGVLTFFLDVLKGFLPVWGLAYSGWLPASPWAADHAALLWGAAAITGHNWPVYLRFRGGKGVATSAGVLLAVAPVAVGWGLLVWVLVFGVSRYVSVASMVAALAVPGVAWWQADGGDRVVPWALTVLGVLVVVRHKTNIQRLINGTESRFRRERA